MFFGDYLLRHSPQPTPFSSHHAIIWRLLITSLPPPSMNYSPDTITWLLFITLLSLLPHHPVIIFSLSWFYHPTSIYFVTTVSLRSFISDSIMRLQFIASHFCLTIREIAHTRNFYHTRYMHIVGMQLLINQYIYRNKCRIHIQSNMPKSANCHIIQYSKFTIGNPVGINPFSPWIWGYYVQQSAGANRPTEIDVFMSNNLMYPSITVHGVLSRRDQNLVQRNIV